MTVPGQPAKQGPRSLDPHLRRYAARTAGMTASEIRALFAVASRPEVVSLAGGMPHLAALPLESLSAEIGQLVATEGLVVAACSALRRVYRDRLRAAITAPVSFVLMDADRDELMRRMTGRPGHYMPPSLLTSQINTLERPGPDEQILTLDSRQPVPTLCTRTVTWLLAGSPNTPSGE